MLVSMVLQLLLLPLLLTSTSVCTTAQTMKQYHSLSRNNHDPPTTPSPTATIERRWRRPQHLELSSHHQSSFMSPTTNTKQHRNRIPLVSPFSPSFSWNNKQHQQQLMIHGGHKIDHTIPPIMTTKRTETTTTRLYAIQPKADNLVSGLAEVSFGFSLGVLFSEQSILQTGCGITNFSDTLERICYQGVIVFAGVALFNRVVNTYSIYGDRTTDLAIAAENYFGTLEESTLWQVRVSEWTSGVAVVGAIVSLVVQDMRGVDMDGLSGIDIGMCRAILDL